jgi:hypothetical protein
MAKALLARFGSFAEVIAAPRARLLEIAGVGEAVAHHLKIVEVAAQRLAKTKVIGRPALSSWAALLDYCTAAMARDANEAFRVLFLDRKNILIADEVQNKGTIDHTPVYPREIVKRALELGASSIILVHNHPSGDPTPKPCRHRNDPRHRQRRQGAAHRGARPSGDWTRRACVVQIAGTAIAMLKSALRKPSTWFTICALGIGGGSWLSLSYIEAAALSQPHHATTEYSQPMRVKGVTRYVTAHQQEWDSWAKKGFYGAILLVFAAAAMETRSGRKPL